MAYCSQKYPAVRLVKAVVAGSGSGTENANDYTRVRYVQGLEILDPVLIFDNLLLYRSGTTW